MIGRLLRFEGAPPANGPPTLVHKIIRVLVHLKDLAIDHVPNLTQRAQVHILQYGLLLLDCGQLFDVDSARCEISQCVHVIFLFFL